MQHGFGRLPAAQQPVPRPPSHCSRYQCITRHSTITYCRRPAKSLRFSGLLRKRRKPLYQTFFEATKDGQVLSLALGEPNTSTTGQYHLYSNKRVPYINRYFGFGAAPKVLGFRFVRSKVGYRRKTGLVQSVSWFFGVLMSLFLTFVVQWSLVEVECWSIANRHMSQMFVFLYFAVFNLSFTFGFCFQVVI